jgi:hypothetical protein
MFADNTLTPREAVRLCALGTIAEKSLHYSQLAASIRHFITRLSGPSLDLMGSSIELLRYEGLIDSTDGLAMEEDPVLVITDSGHAAFQHLMTAPLRPASDLSKLVTALKFRFLHLLSPQDQANQVDLLIDTSETGLNRLLDLRDSMVSEPGYMVDWLNDEITRAEQRQKWLEDLRTRVEL